MHAATLPEPSLDLRSRQWATARGFVLAMGGLLLVTGLGAIIGLLGTSSALTLQDPAFGLPLRLIMAGYGLGSLVIAWRCLLVPTLTANLWLLLWWGCNGVCYRVGLWLMGTRHSCGFFLEPLGLSFPGTDGWFVASALLCSVGGGCMLWMSHRAARQAEFPTMACPCCGGHIRFAVVNLGQTATCPHCQSNVRLRRPDELLKMTCFFCQGHIEFPAHALGKKLHCPHCKKDITLLDPARGAA